MNCKQHRLSRRFHRDIPFDDFSIVKNFWRNEEMPSKPDLISIHETFDPKEAELIQEKLNQYNLLFAPPDNHQSLTLLARDQKDNIIAGLVGVTYWGWLHIEILWVDESLRQQGIGRQILQAAEEEARQRGCRHSHLETHTFQALEFYEKHGYEIYGELPDLPDEYTKYFLKKNLIVMQR